ncbi:YbbR-like domain-containing protein [uncultured Oscillibacter sp.]|uniref:CdaR family protein n=1 Tax=uncultured Oscillibacter sp. TaxID=876091 RepID=UPI0025F5BBF4|nr:CdaR family protein [uncultured Oscillibacter sp.]
MENGKAGRRRLLYLLLSILVACGIWLYVDLSSGRTVTQEFQAIPIEFLYESTLTDRGLMLVEDGTDMTIDLKLSGTRWLISALDRSDIRVTVSLFDVTSAGEQRINWNVSYADSKFNPPAIQTESASIRMATVNISELYSRTIDVSCELVGNVEEPYSAGQVQLSHTAVEVRGLQEDIDPIRYAKVTLDIGESAVETVSRDLELQYYDQSGQLLDKSDIHPNVELIRATLPVFVTKELRLAVEFVDMPGARLRNTDYKIDPETITVSGDAAQLKDVETLFLDRYELAELGTTASESYTTTNYPIIVPDGCQNISGVTRAALRIRFKDMTSAVIDTEDISWLDLPEGKRVEMMTSSLPVKVFGTEADVAALTGEDIAVTVDLGDYSAASGTYTVPAQVSVRKGDIGVSGTYQIQVTIREGGEEPPQEDGTPEEDGPEAEG